MATAAHNDSESVTERTGQVAQYPSKNRFSAIDDADDQDDHGGGVRLCDFEDDSSSESSMGSDKNRLTHARKKAATVSFGKGTTTARRNTIEPIGSGRYSGHTKDATGGASLGAGASVDPWKVAETAGNEAKKLSDPLRQVDNFDMAGPASKAGFPSQAGKMWNTHSQMSPAQNMQFSYAQGLGAPENMSTPSAHRGAMQYPQSATAMRYPWETTPLAYNSGISSNTPQTTGYGGFQGVPPSASFPFLNSDMTPSHMPKQTGKITMDTPQSNVVYSQYNQTEPRNFAPRTGAMPMTMPPPPAFNIGRQSTTNTHHDSRFLGADSDPFLSPTPKLANTHGSSQALILPSVPDYNQLALIARQPFHGAVPTEISALRSAQLNTLTGGPMALPAQDIALDARYFPFIESTTQAAPVGYGVVKLKNIPFGTKRAEIIAFLGRNSKILNDNQEPVHIIMERVSSKTQDCYVEFMTTQDAVKAVDRHRDNVQKGRPSRLGDRPVEVLLSSQAALMQDLFPLASGIWWDNGKPVIQAPIDGQPWKTFKGFVTEEEMTMLVKHVEIPQRSPYSKECPQRPYECMISTIKKLPWYMADRITLRQRHAIYEATVKLIGLLQQALQRDRRNHETTLNQVLLKRLVTAAMLCPGFSVVQKDNIAVLADMEDGRASMFNQPRFAEQWVHLHGICPKPGTPVDVLEWYIAIIREETTRYVHSKHIVERNEIQRTSCYTSLYFGYIWYEIGLPSGKDLDNITLHAVARRELAIIERALRRACPTAARFEMEIN